MARKKSKYRSKRTKCDNIVLSFQDNTIEKQEFSNNIVKKSLKLLIKIY